MSDDTRKVRWLTTGQVAKALGYSRETVRRKCVEGTIPGYQIADGDEWRIPGAWVDEQVAKVRPIKRLNRGGA